LVSDRKIGVTGCADCVFWRHSDKSGTCRRRAPWLREREGEVAHWPQTNPSDCCGDGVAVTASASRLTECRSCLFWHQPLPGEGLDPLDRLDQTMRWWKQAGYCVRHAPHPSSEIGCRAFGRVTHESDCRGEGVDSAG
jgi:hypothetical protein